MKKLLFVALLGLTIAACSKKTTDAVTPDAAGTVAGTYNISYIRSDSAAIPIFGPYNLPIINNGATVGSGLLIVTKITSDSVEVNGRLISPGVKDVPLPYGRFGLKASGAAYTMTAPAQQGYTSQACTIDGKTINIDLSYPDDINSKINYRDVIIGLK